MLATDHSQEVVNRNIFGIHRCYEYYNQPFELHDAAVLDKIAKLEEGGGWMFTCPVIDFSFASMPI